MANLIEAKRLEWKVFVPEAFPCSVCGKREATMVVKIQDDAVVMRVVVCGTCLHLLGAGGIAAAMRQDRGEEAEDDREN